MARFPGENDTFIQFLEPFANIADAYDRNELDEHRPEWGYKDPQSIVLFEGRGGRMLLTLADCIEARRRRDAAGAGGVRG